MEKRTNAHVLIWIAFGLMYFTPIMLVITKNMLILFICLMLVHMVMLTFLSMLFKTNHDIVMAYLFHPLLVTAVLGFGLGYITDVIVLFSLLGLLYAAHLYCIIFAVIKHRKLTLPPAN